MNIETDKPFELKPVDGHICLTVREGKMDAIFCEWVSLVCSRCGMQYPNDHINITIDESELPKLKILLALIQ